MSEIKVENKQSVSDIHKNICKFLTFVLRHKPNVAKLNLDSNGFADISKILEAVEKRFNVKMTEQEIGEITRKYSFNIFKIESGKIKAKVGHSIILNMDLPKDFNELETPPKLLYLMVDSKEIWNIRKNGIQNSNFKSEMMADKNKLPTKENVIIVKVNSEKASDNNVKFYFNNKKAYYCKFIPPQFITIEL